MTTTAPGTPIGKPVGVETRSIDYVPKSERSGKLFDQATVWFPGCAQLLTLATGAIGIGLGLNLGWTLLGLAIGTFLGTIPVSAHATQGPHLGLPQMVQSRPQFGRYGALYIWAMAIIVYWGYVVLDGDLLGATGAQLVGGPPELWVVISCAAAILIAIFGYHWLHRVQKVFTWFLIVVIVIYIVGLSASGHIALEMFDLTQSFDLAAFVTVIVAATGYQLTWAFFVSDYSRYMPFETKKSSIIGITTGGLFTGLFIFMAVGAVGAALLPGEDIIQALWITGDYVFPGLGVMMLVGGALGLIGLSAMCLYGGSLTLITAIDSLKSVRPTRAIRIVTILIIGVTGTIGALLIPADFLNTSFSTVLVIVGYLMAPWTSVNLTDFFFVRKGRYSVSEMFKKDGIYGLWNWRGLVSYAATLLIMVPFMYVGSYMGPVAQALGGIDIAFFVGIPVGCILYWLLCKTQDMTHEREVLEHADDNIDEYAQAIE